MAKRLSITEMQDIASSKGGKCLSSEYKNSFTKLLWQCSEGHTWMANSDGIKSANTWCPECGGTKKLSLESMRDIAEARGGKCLSTEYINIKTKLLWQCDKGHEWKAVPDIVVNRKSWCPDCRIRERRQGIPRKNGLGIIEMQKLANSRGGKCLSIEYINLETKLTWECSKGHQWEANAKSIKHSNTWCPECAQQKFLDELIEVAKSRGGKCLSTEYINNFTKMLWQCSEGHQWQDNAGHIKSNRWCSKCNKNARQEAEEAKIFALMKKHAKLKGGKHLSSKNTYKKQHSKIKFICAEGHVWETSYASVRDSKTWCSKCAQNFKYNLNDLQNLAASRGGLLLSKKYFNTGSKYQWQCSLGHKFNNSWSKVNLRGQWCPTCSKSGVSEEVCRTTFEQIFNREFLKVRPKWLKNERGYQMEIDGFSEELKIGFEYQGIQHFQKGTQYVTTNEKLEQRIQDDKLKAKLCKDNDISLFIISYKNEYLDFPKEIKHQALQFGIEVTKFNFNKKIDLNKAYIRNDRIEELRDILNSKNIELLSNKFLGVKEKYNMRCRIDNHQWSAVGSELLSGAGCKKCSMRILKEKHTGNINNVEDYANKFDGKVLTKDYLGANGKYEFKCKKGHVFFAKLSNLKVRKQWCPFCENRTIRKSALKY